MDKERILVVDDEEAIVRMVSRLIEVLGHEAVPAANGEEALALLKKGAFTILITDIRMPEMDGVELMKRVREQFPSLYVICMTGHTSVYTYTDVIGFGATDYITKPFTLDEIGAKIKRVIREKTLVLDLLRQQLELERANVELTRHGQLKSTFISSVSHELRTPLTVIKEFISLMLEGRAGALTDDQREYLSIANKNILRLTNLIETLLDFSRIESGKGLKLRLEPAKLMEVIEEAAMTLSQQIEGKGITFENRLDPDTPLVLVDRNRIVEVLINLIGNGVKFTPPGGKLSIDSRGVSEKRDFLKLVVSDTGVGISPEDLPKVFERFYQGQRTQEGIIAGTGLGLAITKEILEGHGATIHAESRPGNGASFHFTLPLFDMGNLFQLLILPMLDEADRDGVPFSVIEVRFWNGREKREASIDAEALEGVIYALQKMVRSVDLVIPVRRDRIYILTHTHRKLTREVCERVRVKLVKGGYIPKRLDVKFKACTFPEEAPGREEFVKRLHLILGED